jgi:type IV fimbrial biogenesis protein FimT
MLGLSSSLPRHTLAFPAKSRGFTLQEIMVSLVVSGSLTGGGAGMWVMVQESAMTAAANELLGHLALARSEAIKRQVRVTVCPSKDGMTCSSPSAGYTSWQDGWLAYADSNGNGKPEPAEIVRVQSGVAGGLVIRTSSARNDLTYQPIGTSGGSNITFAICGSRDSASGRYVTVSNTGRARVARTTTSTMKCA